MNKFLKSCFVFLLVLVFCSPVVSYSENESFFWEMKTITSSTVKAIEKIYFRNVTEAEKEEIQQKLGPIIGLLDSINPASEKYSGPIGVERQEFIRKEVEKALNKILSSLDKYSRLFNPKQAKMSDERMHGYAGIGITVTPIGPRGLEIIEVFPKSPAEEAGLEKDWRIEKINGKPIQGRALDEVISEIMGPVGSTVSLGVRKSDGEELIVVVKRAHINVPVLAKKMIKENIGYIKLRSFESDKTGENFKEAIEELESLGMRDLILDLRGNTGGLLNEVDEILEILLPPALVQFFLEARGQYVPGSCTSARVPQLFKGKIVVLVDNFSASASEVVSGALQDHGRALLIGEKTFGKGVVQVVLTLPGGYKLSLTIQEWFTPLDKKINGKGIEPDVKIVDNPETPEDEVIEAAVNLLNIF